jgi:hypothetical protein
LVGTAFAGKAFAVCTTFTVGTFKYRKDHGKSKERKKDERKYSKEYVGKTK